MKKIIKQVFDFASIGMLIGLLISISISYFYDSHIYYPSAPAFVAHFQRPLDAVTVSVILWIIIGQLFGFGSLIFSIRNWSLIKKTIINFITYYFGLLPLAILAGWFPAKAINFLIFTIIFIIIYAVIWAINYHLVKKDIRQLNQKVKDLQKEQIK